MKTYVDRISRVGDDYDVQITTSSPVTFHTFRFSVTGVDIRVVSYSPEFAEFMSLNVGLARPLMEAISALDRAQGSEISTPASVLNDRES